MADAQEFMNQTYGAENVKYLGRGSDSAAFAVDDYVFRFTEKNRRIYTREADICHFLQPYISVRIPDIDVVDTGELFYARHKMITGIKWRWHKFAWKPKKQKNLAYSCAQFLAQLHSVDVAAAKRAVPDIDSALPYVEFHEVEPFLAKFMGPRMLRYFQRRYERIIHQPVAKSDMVIVHMGLKGANSVCNPDGSLGGVFDFGNCGIYERSRDLVLFSLSHNRRLYNDVLRHYMAMTGVTVSKRRIRDLARIEFLWKKRWLMNGQVTQLMDSYFLRKQIAAAMCHFLGLPRFVVRRLMMKWFGVVERRNIRRENAGK